MSEESGIKKEILELLINRCDCESVVNYDCSKLWLNFRYGGMMLELECEEDVEEKYCFTTVEDLDIEEFCHDVKIGKLYITDPRPYDEDLCADYDMSWKMFQMVKAVKYKYPKAVKDYSVCDFLMDPYIMEGENLWCSYFIEIADENKYSLQFVITIIDYLDTNPPETSFNEIMFHGLDITPKYDLRYITTNTKVRRLGYFKLMLALLKDTPLMLDKPFLKKVDERALLHKEELLKYKNSKGIIKQTKSGSGAKPYVDVAIGLNLITKVGNGYELGKVSRAYNAFQKDYTELFAIDFKDKLFFLETILRYDYLYIYTLLEYAYIEHNPSYKDIKGVFQQMVLNNLRQMKEGANKADSFKKFVLQVTEKRIQEWKKPEAYLEHIIMPRLNWLYDLDLLNLRENLSFDLTIEGEHLFSAICGWRDAAGVQVIDPAPFLDKYFMKVFDSVYFCGKNLWQAGTDTYVDLRLIDYLEESFKLFKTFAPNRVTFSVFANYAKWKLYEETSYAIDIDEIVKGFLKRNQDKYIFKFQKFYNDGYIQRIK